MATLYERLRQIEMMGEDLNEPNGSSPINVIEAQRTLFEKYKNNHILYNAIEKKQTITEILEDLGTINVGIRKFLPWRRDETHNQQLDKLGKLISKPYLYTLGIFWPDNPITIIAIMVPIGFFGSYLLGTFEGAALSALFGVLLSFAAYMGRTNKLPFGESKYLDDKIREFYK